MKYWNKDKRVRQEHWSRVQYNGDKSYFEVKRELQLMDSPGKFYLYFGSRSVWFEREQDAVWFQLKTP